MLRSHYLEKIRGSFRTHSVVALLGARQVGKSTLAREFYKKLKVPVHFFDLEDPTDLARLDSPMLTLEPLKGFIVIDEIQRRPDLFSALRVLADRKKNKFLILGSASRDLIQQSSESLAGRIAYIEIRPFTIKEKIKLPNLWIRGGFPLSYLSKSESDAQFWLKNYVSTFLERDIAQLGFRIHPLTMRKFWMMLAHYHGGIFNASEIGKSLGGSGQTIRRHLDILCNTFMIRELQPWIANIDKRQVKAPKIYFRDTGIYHYLLGLHKLSDIHKHPKLGASWEGFALEQLTAHFNLSSEEIFFWSTHAHAELDLLATIKGKKIGFEFKFTDAPKITKSMNISIQDLKLNKLFILYPGSKNFSLSEKIHVIGIEQLRHFDV